MKKPLLTWILLALVVAAVLAWLFVPLVRVWGYQAVYNVGPVKARVWAVERLAGTGEEAVSGLINALGDGEEVVVWYAAHYLSELGPKAVAATPALVDLYMGNCEIDVDYQHPVNVALRKIGPPVLPVLIQALKDEESCNIRDRCWYLANRLAEYGVAAVPALLEALESQHGDTRTVAAMALHIMNLWTDTAVEAAVSAALEAAVPSLIRALEHESALVRESAVQILKAIGPAAKAAVPALISILENGERARTRIPVVEVPGPSIWTIWVDARPHAAVALGQIDPTATAVVAALKAALKDVNHCVRKAAQETLDKIQRPP